MCELCAAIGPNHIQLEGIRLLAALVKYCKSAGNDNYFVFICVMFLYICRTNRQDGHWWLHQMDLCIAWIRACSDGQWWTACTKSSSHTWKWYGVKLIQLIPLKFTTALYHADHVFQIMMEAIDLPKRISSIIELHINSTEIISNAVTFIEGLCVSGKVSKQHKDIGFHEVSNTCSMLVVPMLLYYESPI